MSTNAPAGDCTTSKDSYASGTETYHNQAYNWLSGSFTPATSYTLCSVSVSMAKAGTPSGTIQAAIYTSSAGKPGTLVGTESTAVNATTLNASQADFTFNDLSASLTGSTEYYIVVKCSTTGDASNHVKIFFGYTGEADSIQVSSDGGANWDVLESSMQLRFNSYAQ